MAQAANSFRPASLASLVLHGGALLAMLAGLPPPPAQPVPRVIEIAFLPAVEENASDTAEAALADQAAPVGPSPEAVPEAPLAKPSTPPVAEESTPPPPVEPIAPAEPAAPQPAPPPPHPAPTSHARAIRPRALPRPTPPEPATAAAVAPSPPSAPHASPRAVPQSYIAALFAALDRRKEYPESARWRRAEGTAILRVTLHRDGSVQAWRIERGSGHEDLDQAIGSMVRRASPLPAPPADLPGDPVEFSIPVRFSLR